MYKVKHLFISVMLSVVAVHVAAENGSNSPYTRYGYGDINTTSYSSARGMGGIGIGFRNKAAINPINPASYSGIDSLTFMFDFSASGTYSTFKSNGGKENTFNGNFDYLTMMFPVNRWMGISIGANPYSNVGYDFMSIDTLYGNTPGNQSNADIATQKTYMGDGGLSQIYAGLSAKFLKHYSIGVNAYYLFGNISHTRSVVTSSVSGSSKVGQSDNLHINDFRLRYGFQYFNTIAEKHQVSLGLVYENKTSLNGDYEFTTSYGGTSDETVKSDYGFDFPSLYGVGAYYSNNKLSFGADYSFQDWKNAEFYGKTDTLSNVSKLSLGMEYLPDAFSRKLHGRLRYRFGATLSNSYAELDDKINNFALTLGVGVPFRRNASMLNIALEYGQTGEKGINLIKQDYLKVSLSVTFVERWFLKNVIR